jgi:ribosome-associated translation inhibitor RaiA
MKVQVQYKNLSKSEQEIFDAYFTSKLKSIEALLTHFQDDAVILDCKIEKYFKHDAYDVEYTLKLPMKTIKAKEASHNITKAVDQSKDRLLVQLKKLQSQLQKETVKARKHASLRKPQIHEKKEAAVEEFLKAA